MTNRTKIAIEAMKALLPMHCKPVFVYDPDKVTQKEMEKLVRDMQNKKDGKYIPCPSIEEINPYPHDYGHIAKQCYEIADAMLKESGEQEQMREIWDRIQARRYEEGQIKGWTQYEQEPEGRPPG